MKLTQKNYGPAQIPKFKPGDWVTNGRFVVIIKSIRFEIRNGKTVGFYHSIVDGALCDFYFHYLESHCRYLTETEKSELI
jgi:hypothetical protein